RLEEQKAEMMEKAEITTALIEKVPRATLLSELITRLPRQITLLELNLISKRVKDPAPAAKPAGAPAPAIRTLSGGPAAGGKQAAMAKGPTPPPVAKVPPPRFDTTLTIVGVARENNDIADYLAALKGCSILEKVELKYIKEATIDKLDLRKFEIEAAIRRDADA